MGHPIIVEMDGTTIISKRTYKYCQYRKKAAECAVIRNTDLSNNHLDYLRFRESGQSLYKNIFNLHEQICTRSLQLTGDVSLGHSVDQ